MSLWKLQELLAERGIPVQCRGEMVHHLSIDVPECQITIEARPPWCDRGNFIVKVFPRSELFSIDRDDCFPRYYFGVQACANEIEAWMRKRGLLNAQQQETTA